MGPTQYTHQSSQTPKTSSGPKARAGFIAAPVSGPPARMSNVITSPIASPAIEAKDPRTSAAVANTTQTRKNVRTASSAAPDQASMAGFTTGTPASRFASLG